MKLNAVNQLLLQGNLAPLRKLGLLSQSPFKFNVEFGLTELPLTEGLISIRGARQFGKSTWLETKLAQTIHDFGNGSALYLNGDILSDYKDLIAEICEVSRVLKLSKSPVKRLFIDEITAIKDWQRAIKYLVDTGELEGILVVATGSSAHDLRRGSERLPGRKGRLVRTDYIFPPIGFAEFERVCGKKILDEDLVPSYLISGGSPIGLTEIAINGAISEQLVSLTRDWILGAVVSGGRSREIVIAVMENLSRHAGNPVGYNKLAHDIGLAGVANAQGYIEILTDCLAVAPSYVWDAKRNISLRRKPVKFHIINLLVAVAFSRDQVRSVSDFRRMSCESQGNWIEWLVAQELFRRRCVAGVEIPELFNHFSQGDEEVDFILDPSHWLEVKRGQASPHEFAIVPNGVELQVICSNKLDLNHISGVTLRDFLHRLL